MSFEESKADKNTSIWTAVSNSENQSSTSLAALPSLGLTERKLMGKAPRSQGMFTASPKFSQLVQLKSLDEPRYVPPRAVQTSGNSPDTLDVPPTTQQLKDQDLTGFRMGQNRSIEDLKPKQDLRKHGRRIKKKIISILSGSEQANVAPSPGKEPEDPALAVDMSLEIDL